MKDNSIDELREFFGCLKSKYNHNENTEAVRALPRAQVCIEADMFGLKNTDNASIDRIMVAIKHL